ncbi:disulfide oxidoreductase [Actinomarinicola tropica]|uniref:Disulfide bond formation protein B n=1 Tax=Actinomarinicola tropica TaxID=2789776 RepID=A0A5Q2RK03_9ACTN|nr:disulfide oxidoreductase [Actinomarinicola tropica]QGG94726.1 disulfide bond formation protein B [Actinomarinicola tropica]
MSVQTANAFFSLLSFGALGIAILVVAAVLLARARPGGGAATLVAELRPLALWIAFAIALVATLGSLYYSEVQDFTPCEYCWYQRIAMYPSALVLGIAALRRDTAVKRYIIPLAVLGALMSSYHYYIERFPESGGSCNVLVPCNTPWFEQWGFVTLAFMALTGFLAIVALLSIAGPTTTHEDHDA